MQITEKIAAELGLRHSRVEEAVKLIDEGNTIPFIARYRKEMTGGMSDVELRTLNDRLEYLRNLEARKQEVLNSIEEQGKLTPELRKDIEDAEILQRVEDLYKPFKQKKRTRAVMAREKGLAPLAEIFLAQAVRTGTPEEQAAPFVDAKKGVDDVADAIKGACDIIAEIISDDAAIIDEVRNYTREHGLIASKAVDPEEKTVYENYYDFSEAVGKIPNHRILAVNRGEKEKKLKVKVELEKELVEEVIRRRVITDESSIFTGLLTDTVDDAYKRLIAPSVEREIRGELFERAEKDAVQVFAKNTDKLLMVPPVKGARVLSIDPGYRTGCKVAALSETGKLLAYGTIYPTKPKEDIPGAERTIEKLIDRFKLNTIVIGNGTASRETEKFVADYIAKSGRDLKYTFVNEAGASVYSASKLASEEYPDLDVTTRGAMSLGRRLQDPLAELVKISPRSIGVGQYQHDVDQGMLDKALTDVVEDCVNKVGVDLNTASPSLLSYISGINSAIAKNIVKYREENGVFKNRKELLKVPKLGPKAFEQCAGFLRISGGDNPLDSTAVHPESYAACEAMLERLGIDKAEIAGGGAGDIEEKILAAFPVAGKKSGPADAGNKGKQTGAGRATGEKRDGKKADGARGGRKLPDNGFAALQALMDDPEFNPALKKKARDSKGRDGKGRRQDEAKKPAKTDITKNVELMSKELGIGELTLSDIIREIEKPGRDPRDSMPPVVFRNDVLSFDDLEPGMELSGTVRNVVDFGAFVDIGVKTDGLVHVSHLSKKFVSNPFDVVSVGDNVKVRILEIDKEKNKISLTMNF